MPAQQVARITGRLHHYGTRPEVVDAASGFLEQLHRHQVPAPIARHSWDPDVVWLCWSRADTTLRVELTATGVMAWGSHLGQPQIACGPGAAIRLCRALLAASHQAAAA